MRTPRPLPRHLADMPFTAREARTTGVSTRRLAARDLLHPFHGVHATTPFADLRERCRAYGLVLPEGAWFSHQTGAALLGVPLPHSSIDDEPLHVSVPYPRTPPAGRGVAGHSLGVVSGVLVDGMPICSPPFVWCQLAGVIGKEDLVAAGDHLLGSRRRAPPARLDQLTDISAELCRTKGARARAWALPRLRFGTDSRPETLLRLLLEDWGVQGLEVNHPALVAGGRLTLHPDLSLPRARIAFEYEGDGHRVDRVQWHHDIERRELFEADGWRVIRVTAADVFVDPLAFAARLQRFVPNVRFRAAKAHIRHES